MDKMSLKEVENHFLSKATRILMIKNGSEFDFDVTEPMIAEAFVECTVFKEMQNYVKYRYKGEVPVNEIDLLEYRYLQDFIDDLVKDLKKMQSKNQKFAVYYFHSALETFDDLEAAKDYLLTLLKEPQYKNANRDLYIDSFPADS
ncbi:hypothetical protein [Enterococcus sp. LJL90]